VVEAFDIRPQVKEEVQSVGAKFIEMPLEEDTVADNGYAKEVSLQHTGAHLSSLEPNQLSGLMW
jgi:NAD/NADP transhydrogenase alpha subunit